MAGDTRNPSRFCTHKRSDGGDCRAYALRGLDVCHKHRGNADVQSARIQRELVELGLADPIVPIRKKDLPKLLAESTGWIAEVLADLRKVLTNAGATASVDSFREYSDMLDRLDRSTRTLATLTTATAALPQEEEQEEDAFEAFLAEIDEVRDRLEENAGNMRCGTCSGEGMVCASCGGSGYTPIPAELPPVVLPCDRCATHDAENAALTALLQSALEPYPDAMAAVLRAVEAATE